MTKQVKISFNNDFFKAVSYLRIQADPPESFLEEANKLADQYRLTIKDSTVVEHIATLYKYIDEYCPNGPRGCPKISQAVHDFEKYLKKQTKEDYKIELTF